MLALSERGEWESVAEKTKQREQLFNTFEELDFSNVQAFEILSQIKLVNDQIVELGARAREHTIGQMRSLRTGKKASDAYKG